MPTRKTRAAPDQVAEAAGEQQQAAEGDQVGVHDPDQLRLREAEVALDRGSATLTIAESRMIMSIPVQSTISATQRESVVFIRAPS